MKEVAAQPGDKGPCPLCGKEMGEQGGRYWHMHEVHGILEDYEPPERGNES